ncbi:hypothetical protein AA313_de0201283 [Arthrobotrys entomopaga]|nr:hypothetical protein AA313_de0201283 [Arthrobotrys entomopaga]
MYPPVAPTGTIVGNKPFKAKSCIHETGAGFQNSGSRGGTSFSFNGQTDSQFMPCGMSGNTSKDDAPGERGDESQEQEIEPTKEVYNCAAGHNPCGCWNIAHPPDECGPNCVRPQPPYDQPSYRNRAQIIFDSSESQDEGQLPQG